MRQYVVDAFTERVFAGNQAAVCVCDAWPDDALMQAIAAENNLSETAFLVPGNGPWHIRWFTPTGEIDFCGHATLASAFVVLTQLDAGTDSVRLSTREVGELVVTHVGDLFEMDLPAYELAAVDVTPAMEAALGAPVLEAWMARDLMCVLDGEETVRGLDPNQAALAALDGLIVHATAPGRADGSFDCVTRSFAPRLGVAEDPVCGSDHCHVLPYWSARLDRRDLVAYQTSRRGGTLHGHVASDGRCRISGAAALFSVAELFV